MHDNTNISIDQNKVDQLNDQAFELRLSDLNQALDLSTRALDLAESIGYTKGKADALRTKGFCHIRQSKNTEAQVYVEESLKLYESLNDVQGQAYIYTMLGVVQRNLGNYKASLELLNKSLELTKLSNYDKFEPYLYQHLGTTYKFMGNLEQALECMLQSLSASRVLKNRLTESAPLRSLGSIYDELGDYDNALDYYYQSLVLHQECGDKWGEAGSLNNIGKIYLKQGDHQKAREYCQQSLVITSSVGDKKGEANSLFHLAEIEYLQNNYANALERAQQCLHIREAIGDKKGQAELYLCMADWVKPQLSTDEQMQQQLQLLTNALTLSEETGAQDISLKIHKGLYEIYKQQNKYEKALFHLEAHHALEKEIHSKSFNQKLLNLEITHKVEQSKKEAEIYRLRNVELANLYEESNRQKEEIQTALTKQKAMQAQLVQQEKQWAIERERMRISGELHDDVGGELSTIRLLSEMDLPNANPRQQLSRISASSGELVQKMNEIVWALNVNNDNLQSLLAYIRRFAVKYLDEAGIDCRFEQPAEVPGCFVDGTTRRNIFLLVKEALHNVVKHAGAKNARITVTVEKELMVSIHDNGKGISAEQLEQSTGNGLRNMQQRVKELKGHFGIENHPGTTLCFRLPILQNDTKV